MALADKEVYGDCWELMMVPAIYKSNVLESGQLWRPLDNSGKLSLRRDHDTCLGVPRMLVPSYYFSISGTAVILSCLSVLHSVLPSPLPFLTNHLTWTVSALYYKVQSRKLAFNQGERRKLSEIISSPLTFLGNHLTLKAE